VQGVAKGNKIAKTGTKKRVLNGTIEPVQNALKTLKERVKRV
jgi:hypothetical protein